jgi:ornithine lipid hydroxylase
MRVMASVSKAGEGCDQAAFQGASQARASSASHAASQSGLRALLTYGLFPFIMFGAIGVGLFLLERGVAPAMINPWVTTPAILLIILFERVHPFEPEWNKSHGDLKADSFYFFLMGVTLQLTTTALRFALVPLGGWLAAHVPFQLWPHTWPMLVQIVAALVVGEFGLYWVHRLQHETKLLWRVHAVHHSAPRLYWLNTARFHPFDMILSTIGGFAPLILLGVSEPVMALVVVVGTIHSFFQHCNIHVRLGPLNYFFSMAELHRWHHSKTLDEANANYGNHLSVWDLVFRTRFLPKDRLPPREIGIFSPRDFPMTLGAQLLSPFTFERLLRSERDPQAPAE